MVLRFASRVSGSIICKVAAGYSTYVDGYSSDTCFIGFYSDASMVSFATGSDIFSGLSYQSSSFYEGEKFAWFSEANFLSDTLLLFFYYMLSTGVSRSASV